MICASNLSATEMIETSPCVIQKCCYYPCKSSRSQKGSSASTDDKPKTQAKDETESLKITELV